MAADLVAAHMLPDVFTVPDSITAAEAEALVRTQARRCAAGPGTAP